MSDNDVLYSSIDELRHSYAARALSPLNVIDALLERIATLDPRLHAYVRLDADEARRAAAEAEGAWQSGEARPLEGVPVAIKDVFAWGSTMAGSRLLLGSRAGGVSTVVARLRGAGAIIIGKTATYEFAFGRPSRETPFPAARNPWNLELEPGGSSSGTSVAVAAGLAYAGVGTDTAGSIRWPAAQCGVVGLKPTYGAVPKTGVIPLAWSLDHVGPISRTVRDAAILFELIAGYDPKDATCCGHPVPKVTDDLERSPVGLRVGIPEDLFGPSCHPDIRVVFDRAVGELARLGIELQRVPSISMRQALAITYPLLLAEAASYHAEDLRRRLELYSRDLRVFFTAGLLIGSDQYLRAQRVRNQVRASQLAQLAKVDAFALPTVGFLPDRISDIPVGLTFLSGEDFPLYTMVFNLTGLPAISVPCGFTTAGLPVGLQLAGRPFEEATILRIAHAYEQSMEWRSYQPPLEPKST